MNISLNPRARKVIKRMIAEGRYESESEAVSDVVLQFEDDRNIDWDSVRIAVAEAEKSYRRGDYIQLELRELKGFFNKIKRRGRARQRNKTS